MNSGNILTWKKKRITNLHPSLRSYWHLMALEWRTVCFLHECVSYSVHSIPVDDSALMSIWAPQIRFNELLKILKEYTKFRGCGKLWVDLAEVKEKSKGWISSKIHYKNLKELIKKSIYLRKRKETREIPAFII